MEYKPESVPCCYSTTEGEPELYPTKCSSNHPIPSHWKQHSLHCHTTRLNENSDLGTTYLGRVDMTRGIKIKVEETFPISEQGYTVGRLLDGSECQILLDTGASKSFMSKSHYL